ncbi:MAG: hypothetical protein ABL879_07820 [Devosia sp.]
MTHIARITALLLVGSFVATSALAGSIGPIPMPGKDKPKGNGGVVIIELPGTPKPAKNNPSNPPIYLPIDIHDYDDKPDIPIIVIPSTPGAGNGDGSGATSAPALTPTQTRALKLGCAVAGTPLATPNDIWLTNLSKGVLPAGLKVRFSIETGETGLLVLPQPIQPGEQLLLADIIGATAAGAECSAKAIA